MIKQQRVPMKRSYTPKKKGFYKRYAHEQLLRQLSFEVNKTKLVGDLAYLSDGELLHCINKCLQTLGLITMNDDELNRTLSLKN
jgi:hypothetical protein